MNIDELSLYDWVLYNGKPHRVEAMNRPAQMVGLCSPHFAATTDAKNIEPMPITEDMLIRSGFKYDGTNAFILEQKANEREGKKHFWIKIVPPQPDNDDWWSPDQTGFEVNNDICDMLIEGITNVYVHQFQHVLQLAGINFYDIIKLKED